MEWSVSCLLWDDGYEDTCSFACNTGYEQTGGCKVMLRSLRVMGVVMVVMHTYIM